MGLGAPVLGPAGFSDPVVVTRGRGDPGFGATLFDPANRKNRSGNGKKGRDQRGSGRTGERSGQSVRVNSLGEQSGRSVSDAGV